MPPTDGPNPESDSAPDAETVPTPDPDADGVDVRRGWLSAGAAVAVGSAVVAALLLAGPLDPSGPAVLALLVAGGVLWGVAVTAAVFALRRREAKGGRDGPGRRDR